MKTLLDTIKKNVKVKVKLFTIDNIAFRLHYRVTFVLLVIQMVMLTSTELIGEHIKCMADKGVPEPVINRFCYFTSTFTVVKHLDPDAVSSHAVAHPGVGPLPFNSDEPIKRHAYYQWVPFFLFFQAICFYAPHFIWKHNEGGTLRKLVSGLEFAAYSTDKRVVVNDKVYPARSTIEEKLEQIRTKFRDHLLSNSMWTTYYIMCECLNLINLICQIILTNLFLGGHFLSLGPEILKTGLESQVDVLDVVFPKMTKCTFYKYGPSGTVQAHDALCVMAMNVINEKIFAFMWFWYAILLCVTVGALLWRFTTFLLHNVNVGFNKFVLSTGRIDVDNIKVIMQECTFNEWLFLVYLSSNMDYMVFKNFFEKLANEYRSVKDTKYPSAEENILYTSSPDVDSFDEEKKLYKFE